MKILRLILGDQLNHKHSWYDQPEDNVIYFMAEMRQETDYVKHHIQKVVAFFESMRNFADYLKRCDHKLIYYGINDPGNQQELPKNLNPLIKQEHIEKFEYQLPDEYRLDEQLKSFCGQLTIPSEVYDTEHFLTTR